MKLKNKKNLNLLDKNLNFFRTYLGEEKNKIYYINFKYIKGLKKNFCLFNSNYTKLYLKKFIKILYEYHTNNKRILFLNFSNPKIFKLLLKDSKHYFLPLSLFYLNICYKKEKILNRLKLKILNTKSPKKKLVFIKILNEINHVKKKPDLIIVYNDNNVKFKFIDVLNKFNAPTVVFFNSSKKYSKDSFYKIPGNFTKEFENFIYLLLKSLIKKNG